MQNAFLPRGFQVPGKFTLVLLKLRFGIEIKAVAAVKISLLDWECCLLRQHWSNLSGTFLDGYVIV